VTVTAEQTGDLLEVRIADNGPGIPESRKAFLGKVKRDWKVGNWNRTLSIHSLMDAYDGNIEVEDNEPEGSVFVVQFHVAS